MTREGLDGARGVDAAPETRSVPDREPFERLGSSGRVNTPQRWAWFEKVKHAVGQHGSAVARDKPCETCRGPRSRSL
jgi:hypothetical protein